MAPNSNLLGILPKLFGKAKLKGLYLFTLVNKRIRGASFAWTLQKIQLSFYKSSLKLVLNCNFFRFMVKSNTPPTTTTRVICLTSSKSLTLTPSKSNSSGANNSGAPLMIQRKKGKIEYFTLGANKNQNSSANAPKKSG